MEEHLQQSKKNAEYFVLSEERDSGMLAEWNVVENKLYSDCSGQLNGFIVARLPELDSNAAKVETKEAEMERKSRFVYLQETCGIIFDTCCIVYSGTVSFIISRLQPLKYASDTVSEGAASKKNFYSVLVNAGIVLLVCGSLLFFTGRNKEKSDNDNSEKTIAAAEKNEDGTEGGSGAITLADKQKSDAEAQMKAAEPAKQKTEYEAKTDTALAAKQRADAEAKEKAEGAAESNAEAELAAKKKANENSPWERAVTDNYSPWTINPAERSLEDDAAPALPKEQTANQIINQTPPHSYGVAVNPAVNTVPPYYAQQPVQSGYASSARYAAQNLVPQTSSQYPPQYNHGQYNHGQYNHGQQNPSPYGQYGWSAHQQLNRNGAASGAIPLAENPASYQMQYNQYNQYASLHQNPAAPNPIQPSPVYVASRPQAFSNQPQQVPQSQPVVVPQYGGQPQVQGTTPAAPMMEVPYPLPYSGQPYYPSAVAHPQIR